MKKYYDIGKKKLYPICRSITGNGVRNTLNIIKKEFPNLKIKKIKSGTKVFDWRVPPEWNISEAYVLDKFGKKIIDFKNNNLHVVSYSVAVNKKVKKKEFFKHIYYLKNQSNAIPYVTSYYKKSWGFCISNNQKKIFDKKYKNNDFFKIIIKSDHNKNGYLNYGELILKGQSKQEILISTYICHPSMANNELSGPIVSMGLINYFNKIKKLKKTIRFIFIPETIGSISYLSQNLSYLKNYVIGGYNLSCIGDERQHSCMFSKYKDSPSDEAIIEAYKKLNIKKYKIYSFLLERGSDERQYNSPGIDLPIASIFRTKYKSYPEYHTSLDDFSLVTLNGIKGGYNVAKEAIKILINNIIPKNIILCEPQMGKRGLYPTISKKTRHDAVYESKYGLSIMDFLQFADGRNSLKKISKLIKIDLDKAKIIYNILKKHSLVI
tara:strand:+ start:575 stop:1882 length:1308 start_codon:yes stop_codon:yes gene_type:complete